jgi:hypothetical protein
LGLHGDVGVRVIGHLAGKVNGVAMDDNLTHALIGVMSGDAHDWFLSIFID